MRREKRNERKEEEKIKWGKLISFVIAIILLGVAIAISMSQENTVGEMNYSNLKNNNNNNTVLPTEEASSELSKNVNEVLMANTTNETGGDNEEEDDNEIAEIKNSLETNANTSQNNTTVKNETTENEQNKQENANKVNEDKVQEIKFIYPVEGEVIKEFAKDSLIYSETLEEWVTHTGIDIKAERATVVKSVADGTVK